MAVKWQTYPRWQPPSQAIKDIVRVFEDAQPTIGTPQNQKKSNQVLAALADGLRLLGYTVESQPAVGSEERKKKVKVPVLFGENGKPSKTFEVDAWHDQYGTVLEVEAGTAVDARKLYQDLFEAAVIPGVTSLAVAVMNAYQPPRRATPIDDFGRAKKILDTVDASAFSFPLSSLLLIVTESRHWLHRDVAECTRGYAAVMEARWFRRRLLAWGRPNRRSFPWRETADPWRVLVAEVLLQRSRGKTVAKVYEELFRRWPDAAALSRAREASIASVIRPLGLVQRASSLRAMAREVVLLAGVPNDPVGLLALPGVGRYAANATLVVAFGKRAPVVDGVTARVYRRYFGLPSDLPAAADPELWETVDQATPPGSTRDWNWAVLDLAAEVCLPARPRCGYCPLVERCAYASEVA